MDVFNFHRRNYNYGRLKTHFSSYCRNEEVFGRALHSSIMKF